MHQLKQYWVAEALEKDLGDPTQPESVMSFKSVMELDEREEFPEKDVEWLYNWNLHHYHIPVEYGGELKSYEEFVAFVRVLSRRDLTTSITFSTLFWSGLVWMAGTHEQKQRLAKFIKDKHGAMCLAYSERAHGSDLVASDVQATKVPGGYLLNGEKWPINRATISGISVVLAKTDDSGGARSLSLFVVDKSEIDPAGYSNLPKIKTLGIRGSDMSGIRFDNCFVPEEMRLGQEGAGLELGLKGFHLTRTLCAAFSLGSADTALRTVLKFALGRKLYGKTVFDIPHPRTTLVEAFLDILVCDCVTIAGARSFHVAPEQSSISSIFVKYFVPTAVEKVVQNLSVILGARFYLREGHDEGIFQKVVRDNAIISVFDGSTVVNLHALILQLRQMAKYRAKRNAATYEGLRSRLETRFSLEAPLPPCERAKFELFSRGCDDVLQGLEISLEHLYDLKTDSGVDAEVLQKLITLTSTVLEELDAQDEFLASSGFEYGHDQSPELFELAKKYCTLHAAAACVHMWVYNRKILGDFFAKGEWLAICLNRLLMTFRPSSGIIPSIYIENVAQELLKLDRENKMFSIVPLQLAQSQSQEEKTHAASELQLQA
ncbi:MAG: acyl-CoA dehydrogenase family protein [Cyanobacteriota bacterium]